MKPSIRKMREADTPRAGEILVAAFNGVFARHGFPAPFGAKDAGRSLVGRYLALEPDGCFVATVDGRVAGSGFIHVRGQTAGIGPITVDPDWQAVGVGGALMGAILDAGSEIPSLRLVQDAFNVGSFGLYTGLGFLAKEVVLSLVGDAPRLDDRTALCGVRQARPGDVERLTALDAELTGIVRPRDIEYFLSQPPLLVCEQAGVVTGYLYLLRTGAGTFAGPAATREPAELSALLGYAVALEQGSLLRMRLPARHTTLVSQLLTAGFRIENLQNYMVRGSWQTPVGTDLLALFPEAL